VRASRRSQPSRNAARVASLRSYPGTYRLILTQGRAQPIAPSIQTAVEREVVLVDAFRRANWIAPLIQAVVERQAVLLDAFR